MKAWLLKAMAFSFPMIMGVTSLNTLSAKENHRCLINGHKLNRLRERVDRDFHIIFSDLNNVYTYQGAAEDPNPDNPAISGDIIANSEEIAVAINDIEKALRKLGVSQNKGTIIANQLREFAEIALVYSTEVNLSNTGQPTGDQVATAAALTAIANALGLNFFDLTDNPKFPGLWTTLASLSTQAVQANRRVLDDGNEFGADPSNPASETAAGVSINVLIQEIVARMSTLLVKGLADENCSFERDKGRITTFNFVMIKENR